MLAQSIQSPGSPMNHPGGVLLWATTPSECSPFAWRMGSGLRLIPDSSETDFPLRVLASRNQGVLRRCSGVERASPFAPVFRASLHLPR